MAPRNSKKAPVDVKDPEFEIRLRARRPEYRIKADPIIDEEGWWMLTLANSRTARESKWKVPTKIGVAVWKLVELQAEAHTNAIKAKKDGMLWGLASYYVMVLSTFRRHTENLILQKDRNISLWTSEVDWEPVTLKDCIIRLAGGYGHDNYARGVYEFHCHNRQITGYTMAQYRTSIFGMPSSNRLITFVGARVGSA